MITKLTSYYRGIDIPDLPGNNTFHSKELFLFYEAIPHYTPILIVASQQQQPVGKLLAVFRKNTSLLPSSFFKRCEVYGTGEYLDTCKDPKEVFGEILEHLTHEAMRHASIIEFRNLDYTLDGYKYFRRNNYFSVYWLRVRNSLHRVANIEEQLNDSRLRQVKKGLKNGAEVYEAADERDIKEFSKMLHKIYSIRIRKYFPSSDFFSKMQTMLIDKGLANIYLVKYKGKIIGGSAVLFSDSNAYLWFSGGMTKSYAPQFPGVLAVWAALDDARKRGYQHLEFIDVGLPFQKHGYRSFVLQFGGKQSSTRRWFKFKWTILNKFLIRIYG